MTEDTEKLVAENNKDNKTQEQTTNNSKARDNEHHNSKGITRLTTRRAQTYQTRELHEKPTRCRELPREGRPQTLNATAPTASYKYPERS